MQWDGADEAGGSGVVGYDVYVSDGQRAFRIVAQEDTLLTEAYYKGQIGHTYAFYSVAMDGVGHVEGNACRG